MMHFQDLVAHVAAQRSMLQSVDALVAGIREALNAIKSKADVVQLGVDLQNNEEALARAIIYGTPQQPPGMARPDGTAPPVIRRVEKTDQRVPVTSMQAPAEMGTETLDDPEVDAWKKRHQAAVEENARLVEELRGYKEHEKPQPEHGENGPVDQTASEATQRAAADESRRDQATGRFQRQPADA
jgi:hypothetical protein